MNSDISVDIAILCFNHENFVKEAIESALNQKTIFSFNIFVFDDKSTDNSLNIINSFQARYPDIIRVIASPTNTGPLEAGKSLLKNLTSRYCALIDADDYWTNPDKLQRQIDFLEANPNYAGCFHDAEIISTVKPDDKKNINRSQNIYKTYSQFNHYKPDLYPEDLIRRTIIPTASLVFRNKDLTPYISSKSNALSLYWVLQLEIIKNSKFKYINECWSAYRDHDEGLSKKHDLISFKEHHINVLKELLNDSYYKSYKSTIYEIIALEYRNIIWALPFEKKNTEKKSFYIKSYKHYYKLAGKLQINEMVQQ